MKATKAYAPLALREATRGKTQTTRAPDECIATKYDTNEAIVAVMLISWQAKNALCHTTVTSVDTNAASGDTNATSGDTNVT